MDVTEKIRLVNSEPTEEVVTQEELLNLMKEFGFAISRLLVLPDLICLKKRDSKNIISAI